jgi:hypothetical protein
LNPALRIAGHAVVAGVFFFCLQRFALGETLENSAIWGIAGAGGAALLAWMQQRRAD